MILKWMKKSISNVVKVQEFRNGSNMLNCIDEEINFCDVLACLSYHVLNTLKYNLESRHFMWYFVWLLNLVSNTNVRT
jgi:hypothetical protein